MDFYYFNVQLLPLGKDTPKVGASGYKKLFDTLSVKISDSWSEKKVTDIALESRGNYHAFKPFSVGEVFASGKLSKFDRVSKVVETVNTDNTLFDAGTTLASSQASEFHFLFSYEKHVLAIEKGKKLPAVSVLKRVLSHMLRELSEALFPQHVLEISLLSDCGLISDLKSKADGYYSVDITATFTNSWELVNAETKRLHDEFETNSIGRVEHKEKSARGTLMTKPSLFAMALLYLAIPSGQATISYNDIETNRRVRLNTDDVPVQINIDHLDDDLQPVTDEELYDRMFKSIPSAIDRSLVAKSNDEENLALADVTRGNNE